MANKSAFRAFFVPANFLQLLAHFIKDKNSQKQKKRYRKEYGYGYAHGPQTGDFGQLFKLASRLYRGSWIYVYVSRVRPTWKYLPNYAKNLAHVRVGLAQPINEGGIPT